MRTVQSLHSLIAASPSYLQVFRHNRRRVLISVLSNAIPEVALRDALFILNAPEPTPGHVISPPEAPTQDLSILLRGHKDRARSTASALMRKYFSNHEFDFPSTTPELDRLERLCLLVEDYTDDYALYVASKLTTPVDGTPEKGNWDPPARFAPLSARERARIQGAFYRYELYCRIFRCYDNPLSLSGARWRGDSLFSWNEQLNLFIRRMNLWKVEEMGCVYKYLHSVARGCVREFEDQVVAAIRSAALEADKTRWGTVAYSPGSRPYLGRTSSVFLGNSSSIFLGSSSSVFDELLRNKRADTNEDMVPFELSEQDDLGIFRAKSTDQTRRAFAGKLASYGLAYVRRLETADSKTLSAIIRSETPFGRDFLPNALDDDEIMLMVNRTTTLPPHWNGINATPDRFVWLPSTDRIWGTLGSHTPMWLTRQEMLRDRGYPFWDPVRYADRVTARAFRVLFRVWIDWNVGEWKGDEESVQYRVKGVELPRGERRRIVEEFRFANVPLPGKDWRAPYRGSPSSTSSEVATGWLF